MRKVYRYHDLEFPVADNEDVFFTVEFISDGNMANTVVNVPGEHDPEILDEGTCLLGKGKDLRTETTICFSDIKNPVPEEDTVALRFLLNDVVIQEHSNLKTETERPYVVLFIKFPKKP